MSGIKCNKDGTPRKKRSDFTLLDVEDVEVQEKIKGWLDSEGWESCSQRLFAELGVKNKHGQPVSMTTIYGALSGWRVRRELNEAHAEAEEQRRQMQKFRPGDAKLAREYGEFVFLQRANRTGNHQLFSAATSAQDSRKNIELKEKIEPEKLRQKDEDLRQSQAKLELMQFDAAAAAMKELAALKSIAADRTLSEPEKVAAVRLKLFGTPKTEAGQVAAQKGAA